MNFYAFSALFIASTTFILGIIVYTKNRKGAVNKAFSYFAICVFFWSVAYYFWQVSHDATSALFYCRLLMAGAIFVPVTYLHFVLALIKKADKKSNFLAISYFLFFIFLLTDLTPLFVNRVEPLLNFPFWPRPGIAFHLFLSMWFVYVCYTTYLLYTAYKNSTGLIRDQVKYVLWGFIIGFIAGSSNYILWYKIPIPPYLNILGSVYVAGMAYSIIRYRFMDIRIVARRIFIFIGQAVLTYIAFYLVAWIYEKNFGSIFNNTSYLIGILIAPAFVAIFYWFNNVSQRFANKYLFASLYNYQETINKLSRELNYLIDLKKIIDSIVNTIKQTMQLERAGVLLSDESQKPVHYQIAKTLGFNVQNGISLVSDNFLTQYLQKSKVPLVRDELDYFIENTRLKNEKEGFAKLKDNMTRIEASLCLPLLSSSKLIGIIVLGEKISGDAYTKEDLELLTTLSYQAGIAIDNARLYQEVQDFSQTLKQKVDEQTKDIQMKADHLEKLLKMRSEFLDIASHQLRTPTSVIKGIMSMMVEGDLERMPKEKQKEFVQSAFEKSLKLEQIIHDLLTASEFDSKKYEINTATPKIQLEDVIDKIIKSSQFAASQREIKLSWQKPKQALPPIFGESRYLEEAFSNLIDNAIKYTPSTKKVNEARATRETSGIVEISSELSNQDIIVKVKDNGIGIPKEEIGKLFQKFTRAINATEMYTDGSGLGLFIVKEIIEGHHGKVWVESEINKGTTFYVSLPVAINIK